MRAYDTSYAISRIDKGVRFNGINHITVTFIQQISRLFDTNQDLAFNNGANLFAFMGDFLFGRAIGLIGLNHNPQIFGGATVIYLL